MVWTHPSARGILRGRWCRRYRVFFPLVARPYHRDEDHGAFFASQRTRD